MSNMARAKRIQEIRHMQECSLQEAQQIERRERLAVAVNDAKTLDDLKPILLDIIGRGLTK